MLRQIAASIAITLVALSVAAIVVAQDAGGKAPVASEGSSEMRVRKLPPIGESDPKVDVIKLDHFGRGTISKARLLNAEKSLEQPAELPDTEARPMPFSHTSIQEINPANIAAAKEQAAAQTRSLSSGMQQDEGVVLAADWSASNKVRGGLMNQRSEPSQPQPQPVSAPSANSGYSHAPQGYSQRNSSTLQDKLNSLRDAFIGNDSQPTRTTNQSARGYRPPHAPYDAPQVSPGQPYTPGNDTPSVMANSPQKPTVNREPELAEETESMVPLVRSSAPEPPGVPALGSRTARVGTPTLAQGSAPTTPVRSSERSLLESSRQRRAPVEYDQPELEARADESDYLGVGGGSTQPRGASVVASEPISPAVPKVASSTASVTADSYSNSVDPVEEEARMASITPRPKRNTLPQSDNVLMTVSGPQLSAQAVGPRRIVISQKAEFQVTVTNSGGVEANDVVVSVQLPNWVDVQGTEPSRGTADVPTAEQTEQPLLWRIARLEANSSEVLKISLVPRRSQPLDMSVRWTYAQTATNALVEVEEPMLQMVISGPSEAVYGQTKLYNLTLSNPGTGDAQNVVLSLLPLEGKQESPVSTKVGMLGRGETKTIQIELSAGKSGVLLVKANATADGGLSAEASKEVLVRRANLVIEVVAPEAEYAGNPANFVVRVINDGNAPAEDVTVNAVLPNGAEYVTTSGDGRFEEKQGRVRWDMGSLAAGQMREYQLSAKLHMPGENRLHTAVQDKSDLTAVAEVQTAVIARADLKLFVADPKGPVPVGEEAVYELSIRNRGTDAAEAIEAVIFFSEGIEPVRVEGADHEIGTGQVVFKTIPKIAANGELVLKVTARADRPGNHVFRAEVLCRSIGTKLAAEETTHFYGKELTAEASRPASRTAARPTPTVQRLPGQTQASPSPLPPAKIDTK